MSCKVQTICAAREVGIVLNEDGKREVCRNSQNQQFIQLLLQSAPVMKYIDAVCEMQEKKQLENRD